MLKKEQVVILSDNKKYMILEVFNLEKDIVYLAMQVSSNPSFCLLKEVEGGLVLEDDEKNIVEIYNNHISKYLKKKD